MFAQDPTGEECVTMAHYESSKNHPVGINDTESSMHMETKLNPSCEALFQYPKRQNRYKLSCESTKKLRAGQSDKIRKWEDRTKNARLPLDDLRQTLEQCDNVVLTNRDKFKYRESKHQNRRKTPE